MSAADGARAFLARVLGWGDERGVELALRSLTLALDHRAALVLCGDEDLAPIAWALHRRTLGPASPFVVCDPRRRTETATVRLPASRMRATDALEAAAGGSLFVRSQRLPADFAALVARLHRTDDVPCLLCAAQPDPPLILPAPLVVPPLARRVTELDRIIAEYARDASAALEESCSAFTADDHSWVREHAATSLADIEKATLRLVAIRTSRNLSHAATRLGMAPVSLSRWLGRRKPPRMRSNGGGCR